MTQRRVIQSRSKDLVVLLGDLKRLHEEMLGVIRQKLAAMRQADTDALNSCLARERFLADRISQQEGLRQQLVQIIGKALGLELEARRTLTLSVLAEGLPEPERTQLLGLAAALRECLGQIESANKVAALVTGEMLKHFRQVYSAMARAGQTTGTYSSGGQLTTDRPTQVFDAVG